MADTEVSVQAHYASTDLVERILAALEAHGEDVAQPTVEMLQMVDQLHGGGLAATLALAEATDLKPGMHALDNGCGIGGAARFLAANHGCRVDAIDLTAEYVEAADRLNALCGLSEAISVRQASVTDLPFADGRFDIVWCQNVTMNVEDKATMFAEAFRVLVPGGRFAVSHAAEGPGGPPYYPLPWAREPSYSFLGTPEAFIEGLEQAGFRIVRNLAEGAVGSGRAKRPPKGLGVVIAMGADMPERVRNSMRSSDEDRLKGMIVVAEKPA